MPFKKIKSRKKKPFDLDSLPSVIFTAGGVTSISAENVEPNLNKGDTAEAKTPSLKRFDGNAYTGGEMTPEGWYTPVIIDLAGIKIPSQHRPALRQHDHEQIVGHTDKVSIDAEGVKVGGVFSGQATHADKVTDPASKGFKWQLSIGANPIRRSYLEHGEETTVNGRVVKGPMVISHETELGEVSFVPLGADGNTSVRVTGSSNSKGLLMSRRALFNKAALKLARDKGLTAAKYSDEEIDKMTEEETKAALKECMSGADQDESPDGGEDADAADDDDMDAADDDDMDAEDDEAPAKSSRGGRRISASKGGKRIKASKSGKRIKANQYGLDDIGDRIAKAQAAQIRRANAIQAAVSRRGVTTIKLNGKTVDLVAHAIENNWSVDRAELYALRAARPGESIGVPGGLVYSTSRPELNEAVFEAAVLQASRHQFKLNDDSFYYDQAPGGGAPIRRISHHLENDARRDFVRAGGSQSVRYSDQVQQAAHTMFKGQIGLHQFLEMSFRAAGVGDRALNFKNEGGIRDAFKAWQFASDRAEFGGGSTGIRAEGASQLSIQNILANVLNKFALQGYLFTEQAWRDVCAIRPVNDFKPARSINLLGDVMYKALGPSGELENASIGDQAFTNQAQPFGRILTIPWTHIVNDDLGILSTIPQKIGQGAGLALNNAIWSLWTAMYAGTVNGDDGNPFWRTTTSAVMGKAYKPNKTSGAGSALSATSLQTVKALFDNQVDPNNNPLGFDGMTPVLLHGPTNWQIVNQLLQSAALVYGGATAALQPATNIWQGRMKPVMSRYLESPSYVNSSTAWWVLFDPVALATIEVAFLNGVDTPAVLQAGPDFQFDRLGISIRGTMPFGCNQQNFRGGVFSAGA